MLDAGWRLQKWAWAAWRVSRASAHGEDFTDVDASRPSEERARYRMGQRSKRCGQQRIQRLDLINQVLDTDGLVGRINADQRVAGKQEQVLHRLQHRPARLHHEPEKVPGIGGADDEGAPRPQ